MTAEDITSNPFTTQNQNDGYFDSIVEAHKRISIQHTYSNGVIDL